MRSERRVASLPFVRSRTLYLDDNTKLKMDIKGLVFKKPRGGACSTIERDDADIVVIITRRGKGTERFARRVGLLCPKTLKHYVEACVCGSDSAQRRRPRTHRCLYRGPPLVKRQADRLADGRRRRIRIYVKKLSRAVQKKVLAETVLKRSAACAMSASSGTRDQQRFTSANNSARAEP